MKPDGFPYCELFREVPEKRLYPDYYVVIPEPISLKEITAKLKKRQYLSIEEVIADFSLMASNAKTYNSDASTIYKVITIYPLTHPFIPSLTYLLVLGCRAHERLLHKLFNE